MCLLFYSIEDNSPKDQSSFTWSDWLNLFKGVARTGGMRFASDVTLESGLTRLVLGS